MTALFEDYTSKDMYEKDGVMWCVPMTAKEIESEDDQIKALSSEDHYVEEKFDGTRATLHIFSRFVRCFSRRVSDVTGWFCENSDSLPHIRDLKVPSLEGTIIDGEMFIPGRPFKDVASVLNCKWDKAVARQEELGKVVFHAFDIIYYKGIDLRNFPLHRRKRFLQYVVNTINSPYVEMVKYYSCDALIPVYVGERLKKTLSSLVDKYPTLVRDLCKSTKVTPRGYYEYIVATGGEGVIVKPKNGKYYYKRGWEYSKIKKFLTREVIIMGFTPPTREYKGKFPDPESWRYWEDCVGDFYDTSSPEVLKYVKDNLSECAPVSKYFYEQWVGNIIFGVIVSDEDITRLPKGKKFNIQTMTIEGKSVRVLEVGECAGFDEAQRIEFSNSPDSFIGSTIEVKANEIFKDTGKLRHPRFLRLRFDKSPLLCTWTDHINVEVYK